MHQVDPDAGWRSENVEHLVFPFCWRGVPWIVLWPLCHSLSSRPAGLSDSNGPPAALMSVNPASEVEVRGLAWHPLGPLKVAPVPATRNILLSARGCVIPGRDRLKPGGPAGALVEAVDGAERREGGMPSVGTIYQLCSPPGLRRSPSSE